VPEKTWPTIQKLREETTEAILKSAEEYLSDESLTETVNAIIGGAIETWILEYLGVRRSWSGSSYDAASPQRIRTLLRERTQDIIDGLIAPTLAEELRKLEQDKGFV
jgi:hypothetical protein